MAVLAQAEWVDGGLPSAAGGDRQTKPADRYRTPLYARLQAATRRCAAIRSFFRRAPADNFAPLFNRYGPGRDYGFHVDGAVRQNGEAGWMRTDLSATLFLCEPESYEGGELVIEDT